MVDQPLAGIVVAGGGSRRMGADKRRLRLWGPAGPHLLGHAVDLLAPLCAELVVVLNDPADWPDLPARLVADAHPASGALGGLVSGLAAISSPAALVIAADMPLIAPAILRALASWPLAGDALIPSDPAHPGRRQPLLARYRQSACAPLRAAFERGERRLQAALADLRCVDPGPALWQVADPAARSLVNINTPADLALARQLCSPEPLC